MSKIGFEVVAKAIAFIFIRDLLYRAPYRHCVCVPSVVSPMGDKIGYIVDGRLVANEQMRGVLKDE